VNEIGLGAERHLSSVPPTVAKPTCSDDVVARIFAAFAPWEKVFSRASAGIDTIG
jgi:hypothetical protein